MTECFPLTEIVSAMQALNSRLHLNVTSNLIHFRYDPERAYYECWLHEVGHLIAFTRSLAVPIGTRGHDYLDELMSARMERYADRNEARALAISCVTARLFGHALPTRQLIAAANTFVTSTKQLRAWVYRDLRHGRTTPVFARKIYNAVAQQIARSRMKLKIGDIEFSTKKAAAEHCRELLKTLPASEPVDAATKTFLTGLLTRHPKATEKVGAGIKDFFVVQGQFGRCFHVLRVDDTTEDFSYTKCLGG